jgi:polyphosphate kinase 2 (PPK2 family)
VNETKSTSSNGRRIVDPVYKSKKQYQKMLADHVTQLSALQELHNASDGHAILLIFQAMGATGKDGAIRT